MKYKKGYKYQLVEDFILQEAIPESSEYAVSLEVSGNFVSIIDGRIEIECGYAWDGPSGPTIDTKNFIRGSLVHDAIYQLMRHGLLDSSYRNRADELLRDICREDGMSRFRSWYVYMSVRMFGGKNVLPSASREVLEAP